MTARLRRAITPLLLAAAAVMLAAGLSTAVHGGPAGDASAYWGVWRNHVYHAAPGQAGAFLYSPAVAQLLWAPARLPWPVFYAALMLVNAACFAWLVRPLGARRGALVFLLCTPGIAAGNIFGLLALVLAVGFRHAGAWAVPLLTKVTPAVGIVWFAARREWRQLGTVLLVAAVACAVSYALAPGLWQTWVRMLVHPDSFRVAGHQSPRPLFHLRLVAALGVTVWAARRSRPRWLAVAAVLATPVIGPVYLTILAAMPRMRADGVAA